ncbi:hypothetical protein Ahia01_000938400, partial [Argonauta hians]
LFKGVDQIKHRKGATYTNKALDYIRLSSLTPEAGDRKDVPNIVIVITDGQSSRQSDTKRSAQLLKLTGAVVIAIGVGNDISRKELLTISSESNKTNVFTVANFEALKSIEKNLILKACKMDPCKGNPCLNGGSCRAHDSNYICYCTVGFKGTNCSIENPCSTRPCRNGGSCIEKRDKFTCVCTPGYRGKDCSI